MIRIKSVVTKILLILTVYNKFQTFCLNYLIRLAISKGDFAPKNSIGLFKPKIWTHLGLGAKNGTDQRHLIFTSFKWEQSTLSFINFGLQAEIWPYLHSQQQSKYHNFFTLVFKIEIWSYISILAKIDKLRVFYLLEISKLMKIKCL